MFNCYVFYCCFVVVIVCLFLIKCLYLYFVYFILDSHAYESYGSVEISLVSLTIYTNLPFLKINII